MFFRQGFLPASLRLLIDKPSVKPIHPCRLNQLVRHGIGPALFHQQVLKPFHFSAMGGLGHKNRAQYFDAVSVSRIHHIRGGRNNESFP